MRILILLAKAAVTLGLLVYLWFRIDPAAAFTQFRNSDTYELVAGTAVLALLPLIGALRWRLILSALGSPWPLVPVTRWTYVSVFFGQVLPATVGTDALRVWLAHRAGFSVKLALNSVALDRVAMFLALALLLAAVMPGLGSLVDATEFRYLAALLLGGTLAGLAALMLGDRLPASWQRFRAIRAIGYLAHDARRLLLDPRFGAATLALCVVSYVAIIIAVYFFALAFGVKVALGQLFLLLPPVLVASALPISIGGWGTREVAMLMALGAVGVDPHTAVLVSLWLGVASILISLPGALFFYMTDRAPLRDAALRAGP